MSRVGGKRRKMAERVRDLGLPTRSEVSAAHDVLRQIEKLIPGDWSIAQKLAFTDQFVNTVSTGMRRQAQEVERTMVEGLLVTLAAHPKWRLEYDKLVVLAMQPGEFERRLEMDYNRVIRAVEADLKQRFQPTAATHFRDLGEYYDAVGEA